MAQKAPSKFQNPFVWYDLMTPDVEGAKAFYGAVLGWTYDLQPPSYALCNVGKVGVGGIMEMPEHLNGMPPFWSGYIYTPDVDAACAAIKAAGGAIHREPWDIPGIIRMAVVGDPTGAFFDIMQPLMERSEEPVKPGTMGSVGWRELLSAEPDKAWAFYEKLFGWRKGAEHDMGAAFGVYQLFQIDGKDAGGMMKKMQSMPMSVWNYYWWVDGIEAATTRVKEAGGAITNGPMEVPGGQWVVNATDPQGAHFALLSNTK